MTRKLYAHESLLHSYTYDMYCGIAPADSLPLLLAHVLLGNLRL